MGVWYSLVILFSGGCFLFCSYVYKTHLLFQGELLFILMSDVNLINCFTVVFVKWLPDSSAVR